MNVVPLHRPTPAEARMRARLERAIVPVKAANEKLVGELVAAMQEGMGAGVDGALAYAIAVGTINDIAQAFLRAAIAARDELERASGRNGGEPA